MVLIYSNTINSVTIEVKNRYSGNKVTGHGTNEKDLRARLEKELEAKDNE